MPTLRKGRDRHQSRACAGSRAVVAHRRWCRMPRLRLVAWWTPARGCAPARRRSPCACGRRPSTRSPASATCSRPGSPLVALAGDRTRRVRLGVGHPLGAARHGQDDPRAGDRPLVGSQVRRALRRHRRRARRARGDGGGADQPRPLRTSRRSSSSTRSTASRRRSRTRCCPASRTAGSSSSRPRPRTPRSP